MTKTLVEIINEEVTLHERVNGCKPDIIALTYYQMAILSREHQEGFNDGRITHLFGVPIKFI